ncbi:Zinc finger protein 792 [Echinococcus granulosus]|uniref:Zinc finger protein 792 n=1 Tax=Echinococcus granulosus TaxID=6210 RepID=W6UJ47_ECHGR|nr:Zinc finger protein 792 [Echinococcus granulosus]EUB61048.1 Zinc finger protein 792 [Echinococcus granulosus]
MLIFLTPTVVDGATLCPGHCIFPGGPVSGSCGPIMTDHRLFGQTDIDEVDGGELSLCCICGKTFLDRRSLHLHVAIDHEKEALTVSDTPPLAHSSTMNQIDEVDTCVPLPSLVVARSVAAAAVAAVDGADGESSDESCRPQDLRIRRSPIDCVSSGSVAAPPPILALPTANSRTTPPSSSLIATTSAAYLYQDVSTILHSPTPSCIGDAQVNCAGTVSVRLSAIDFYLLESRDRAASPEDRHVFPPWILLYLSIITGSTVPCPTSDSKSSKLYAANINCHAAKRMRAPAGGRLGIGPSDRPLAHPRAPVYPNLGFEGGECDEGFCNSSSMRGGALMDLWRFCFEYLALEINLGNLSLIFILVHVGLTRKWIPLILLLEYGGYFGQDLEIDVASITDPCMYISLTYMNEREAYESQSDAINSGQSSTTEFPSNEHLPSQTSSPEHGDLFRLTQLLLVVVSGCTVNPFNQPIGHQIFVTYTKRLTCFAFASMCELLKEKDFETEKRHRNMVSIDCGLKKFAAWRSGKSYHCELCNKYFTKSCNLNSHVKAVHKGVTWGSTSTYDSTNTMMEKQNHPGCHLDYPIPSSLSIEMMIVVVKNGSRKLCKKAVTNCGLFMCLGVRAFQCSECQKSFSRNSDLQKHIDAVHKGLRPYECSTCQKRFSQKSSLKRHREAVHEGEVLM